VRAGGEGFDYDYLIVSLGAEVAPTADLSGLDAPWELDAAIAAGEHLADFDGGKVVVGVEQWPYRCPPAPFEAAKRRNTSGSLSRAPSRPYSTR